MKKFIVVGNISTLVSLEFFDFYIEKNLAKGKNKITNFNTTTGIKKVGGCWYTNFDVDFRKELDLKEKYDPKKHLDADNYDAINIDSIKDIPCDYNDMMLVPISIFDYKYEKYFDILDTTNRRKSKYRIKKYKDNNFNVASCIKIGNLLIQKFTRVLIKRKL